MKLNKQDVARELRSITEQQVSRLQQWKKYSTDELNQKPEDGGWSVLECMEHLRRYMEAYLPELKNKIKHGSVSNKAIYRTGWLGYYSAQSMLPEDKRSRKMKTFSSKNPAGSQLEKGVFSQLEDQLKELNQLLEVSLDKNWDRIRVKTTLGSWLRFKLGDIFRFLVYHNLRHFQQASRLIDGVA